MLHAAHKVPQTPYCSNTASTSRVQPMPQIPNNGTPWKNAYENTNSMIPPRPQSG